MVAATDTVVGAHFSQTGDQHVRRLTAALPGMLQYVAGAVCCKISSSVHTTVNVAQLARMFMLHRTVAQYAMTLFAGRHGLSG